MSSPCLDGCLCLCGARLRDILDSFSVTSAANVFVLESLRLGGDLGFVALGHMVGDRDVGLAFDVTGGEDQVDLFKHLALGLRVEEEDHRNKETVKNSKEEEGAPVD